MKMNKLYRLLDNYLIHPVVSFIWRRRNHNRDFTLISNNCWGGGVYQDLQIPYMSPTVGLFFYPDDYIEFLSQLEYYCKSATLTFTRSSKYKKHMTDYPVGLLDDKVEIHFLHYISDEEAREKWCRRIDRMNWNNLYVKMDDRDGCMNGHIAKFDALPFKNKICFTAQELSFQSVVYLPKCKGRSYVGELYGNKYLWSFDFDLVAWLNDK